MEIKINTEYIKLDQLLKFSGFASSGADAKDMILAGIVSVDGDICLMRGKKIVSGSVVTLDFGDNEIEELKVK